MKVLIAGEASVHLSNFCRAIRQHVDDIVVVTETPLVVPEARTQYLVSFRSMNPLQWWSGWRRLKKILAAEEPDLIHLHQVNRLAYFACKANRGQRPVITTAWGSDVLLVPERNFMYRYFTRQVLHQSSLVTADALVMMDAMMRLVPASGKYVWLQYGIDPVEPAAKEQIIFSNRLHRPLYNIAVILEDFAAFARSHPGWMLHIAGSGPETGKLEAQARELKIAQQVKFLGWLSKEENAAEYAKARVYVSIPSSDGTSVSLLEAMSAGCIPVVSDLPVVHEWITDGVNGVIRKRDSNPFPLALQLDGETCARINREKTAPLSREAMTRQFYELYQKVRKP